MPLFAEKGDFQNKKRPKRDPKSDLGLLRDPGLPKRDPVGSSGFISEITFMATKKILRRSIIRNS